jgi:hypothetical protein
VQLKRARPKIKPFEALSDVLDAAKACMSEMCSSDVQALAVPLK